MYNNYLEKFAENNISLLPNDWESYINKQFGLTWTLHDFQLSALKNALVVLYFTYKSNNTNYIQQYFNRLNKYKINDINNIFQTYKNSVDKCYHKDFDLLNTISGINSLFFKQMCFWMATGSGKTLVIIKLIEMLSMLILDKKIPNYDIMISSANDTIIEQIKTHIEIFNKNSDIEIEFVPLKDFKKNKYYNGPSIKVYYTTTSSVVSEKLVSKKNKEGKRINYEEVYNNGEWYVFLDEAHKGDEDSSSQAYFHLLSSKGFMFNFSATFIDTIKRINTVYNMNLDKFIRSGYGKQIRVMNYGFNKLDTNLEKKISIIQSLLLLTAQKKAKKLLYSYYHNPLLLVFAHSINKKYTSSIKSDLKEFFIVLNDIINNSIDENIFKESTAILLSDIQPNPAYTIGDDGYVPIDFIKSITIQDIGMYSLNAYNNTKSILEVYKLSSNNKSEVALKLKNSNTPFALLKFSDAHNWIEDVLPKSSEIYSIDDSNYFSEINNESSTYTMLLGSRMFIEGWDSNRPNIIHFIGLGMNSENSKLILQAIGRGVRIEPMKNYRKRNDYLPVCDSIQVKNEPNNSVSFDDAIKLIESLFIFATNQENINSILKSLYDEKGDYNYINISDKIQPISQKEDLLLPEYDQIADCDKIYKITKKQLDEIKCFIKNKKTIFLFEYIHNKSEYIEYFPKLCKNIENNEQIEIVKSCKDEALINENLLINMLEFYTKQRHLFSKFRNITDHDIIHYKYIEVKITNDHTYNDLSDKIDKIMHSNEKTIADIQAEIINFMSSGDQNKVLEAVSALSHAKIVSKSIKKITTHYYNPVFISDIAEFEFKNSIDVESEKIFIDDLLKYIGNISDSVEWWYFSKINQYYDKGIYIPYINTYNSEYKFYPDFIFWIKLKNKYKVVFVDPKGLIHEQNPIEKIQGFRNIFNSNPYKFDKMEQNIEIQLYYYNKDKQSNNLLEEHRIDSCSINKIFT